MPRLFRGGRANEVPRPAVALARSRSPPKRGGAVPGLAPENDAKVAAAIYGAAVWLLNPPLARMTLRTVGVLMPGGKKTSPSTSPAEGPTSMKELKIKRRGVLLSLAALLVPGTASGMWWLVGGTPKTLAEALFSDIASARKIGVKYLAQTAHECDAGILAAYLPQGCAMPPSSPFAIDDIRKTVDAQRQRDFATGDTVLVDGWILSRTEARLCALAALSA